MLFFLYFSLFYRCLFSLISMANNATFLVSRLYLSKGEKYVKERNIWPVSKYQTSLMSQSIRQ